MYYLQTLPQDVDYIGAGEYHVAALIDRAGIGNAFEHGLVGTAVGDVHCHSQAAHPLLHPFETFQGHFLCALAFRANIPNILRQQTEFLDGILRTADQQPVIGSAYGRESVSVSGVGICRNGLAQHVDHPICRLAAFDKAVQRPSGSPHDVAPRLVILRIYQHFAGTNYERTH